MVDEFSGVVPLARCDHVLHAVTAEFWLIEWEFEWLLKEHVPTCMVLVINDNPYGLMFVLSYICRTCP
jgi:hypothetical protein